ncbi:hypothetical protein EAH80_14955 [Mycobacterium hodleri]|uniref:N-acetyltransferase domain-containing protein n=2 Tax=Mycolicibacterium hodleri TaxID=49897 RepID=A0A502E7Z2_9MYCO|nr:hypothetical protein EAH80_14955 [Mycolicibacterium hodleri]
MTPDDAVQISGWHYPGRWSVYDLHSPTDIVDELDLYRAVTDGDDNLIGFLCVDSAARVPGLNADPNILDVGVGMDSCLVGRGNGQAFGKAVLEYLNSRHPGRPLRAVIQSWNVRSRRFAATAGFIDVGELSSTKGEHQAFYRILLKPDSALVAATGVQNDA